MAKFRKKPVVIEAIQFNDSPERINDIQNFMDQSILLSYRYRNNPSLIISTLEGDMSANVGDWIIKGVNGEFYPIKNDIFEKTYEPVD